MRIGSLEDSLQKQMNPSGLSASANNSATTVASESITTETSFYKSDKSKAGNTQQAATVRDKRFPGEFPEGSSKILTDKNVEFLSKWGLKVMLNEIYARHGMTFTDGDLQNHFKREDWYTGSKDNVDDQLSDKEKRNIIFITNYKFTPQIPS